MRHVDEKTTHYLNTDLEIRSKVDLQLLVGGFGSRVMVSYVGRVAGKPVRPKGTRFFAAMSLTPPFKFKDASAAIRRYAALVDGLPLEARRIWDTALDRDLNIGVQAGAGPPMFEMPISPEILRLAASIDARITVTIYGSHVMIEETPARS